MVQQDRIDTPRYTNMERLENGDVDIENTRHTLPQMADSSDEYTNLLRYIATYRDGRRRSTAFVLSGNGDDYKDEQPKKRPWWAFWCQKTSSGVEGNVVVPDEWVTTNIRQGLSSSDVESQRRKVG